MNKEKITFIACLSLVIGACMGNIMLSLFFISVKTPLLCWLIASLVCYCYAVIVLELVKKYPERGGIYLFPRRIIGGRYGTIIGFFCGWGCIVSSIILTSVIASFSTIEGVILILFSAIALLLGHRVHKTIQILFVAAAMFYFFYSILNGNIRISEGYDNQLSSFPLILFTYCGSLILPFITPSVNLKIKSLKFALSIGLILILAITLSVLSLKHSFLFMFFAFFLTIINFAKMSVTVMQAMVEDGFFSSMFYDEKKTIIVIIAISLLLSLFIDSDSKFFLLTVALTLFSLFFVPLSFYLFHPAGKILHLISALIAGVFLFSFFSIIYIGGWVVLINVILIFLIGVLFFLPGYKNIKKRFSGIVVHGKGRGHIFDIPTANIELFEGQVLPDYGVWQVKVFVRGQIYDGVTNVGLRPTDDLSQIPTIETMLLNFSESIYEEKMTIELVNFIRETRQFASMDELKKQIQDDISSCI